MGQLVQGLLSLSDWAALALVFMLPALEAPAFLGLVLPGELILLLGGVLAQQGRVPLGAALAVGIAGALAGDTAAYWIGRRWGPPLLATRLGRRVGPARRHRVEALLLRGGGWALVVGRCTAGARVLLPGLAGILGLRYRVFAVWTGMAATGWAIAHVLLGYAAGAGWRHAHQLAGRVGIALALAVVVTWPSPGSSAARPGDTTTSQASSSRQGDAATRPTACTTQRHASRSGSSGEGRLWPATTESWGDGLRPAAS
jgi:membrane protein DedA with SNARE-associated domain